MNRILFTIIFILFSIIISQKGYSQNLIKNGDFEYPVTDELSFKITQHDEIQGWKCDLLVSIINHIRLFPFSNFLCLLLPAISRQKTGIRQDFNVDGNSQINVSYAFAASRIESGKLKVFIDGHEIDSREYTDYWIRSEMRLSDHIHIHAIYSDLSEGAWGNLLHVRK